ncbi:hypothetical protein M5U04_20090 [Xenorhabdus sp. XENO-1]|nr:hypothetical protein [Xenorhabdus bovienii]MCP9270309.1 hypothetical protein [Xenorhabdus bovienii subsp. africana]
MDIADTTNDTVELMVSHALQNRTPPLPATHGAFCSRECGEDYERLRRQ